MIRKLLSTFALALVTAFFLASVEKPAHAEGFASHFRTEQVRSEDPSLERARDRVATMAELSDAQRTLLLDSLETMPEHRRWFDATFALFSGYPETLGVCLDGFPANELEIEACAGVHLAIVSLSLGLRYRWDLWNARQADGVGPQLALGPGLSYRHMRRCPYGSCATSNGFDALGSLEFTYWLASHFGLQVELDLGLSVQWTSSAPGSTEEMLHPIGRLTFGFAF